MTTQTVSRKTKIGTAKVFDQNTLSCRSRNVRSLVAVPAIYLRVFAFQRIPCLSVVKLPDWNIPVNQVKIPSVVVAMALDTGPLCFVRTDQGGVQAFLCRQALANIAVAVKAFELRRPYASVMAIRAVAGTVQETMGFGKLARRYLGAAFRASDQQQQPCQAYVCDQPPDLPVVLSGTTHGVPSGMGRYGLWSAT